MFGDFPGATCALDRKFSRSNFFPQCRRYGATYILYIGELCRYLLTIEPVIYPLFYIYFWSETFHVIIWVYNSIISKFYVIYFNT